MTHCQQKKILRSRLSSQRHQLSLTQQEEASYSLAVHAKNITALHNARTICSYQAYNGEISPEPILSQTQAYVYLPRIIDFKQGIMRFYSQHNPQEKNRYGIIEPIENEMMISAHQTDIIFLPLVAFTVKGHRLGMGAGFYDRALFECKRHKKSPLLIGIAYQFQQVKSLPIESWDQSLDIIITDQGIINAHP